MIKDQECFNVSSVHLRHKTVDLQYTQLPETIINISIYEYGFVKTKYVKFAIKNSVLHLEGTHLCNACSDLSYL